MSFMAEADDLRSRVGNMNRMGWLAVHTKVGWTNTMRGVEDLCRTGLFRHRFAWRRPPLHSDATRRPPAAFPDLPPYCKWPVGTTACPDFRPLKGGAKNLTIACLVTSETIKICRHLDDAVVQVLKFRGTRVASRRGINRTPSSTTLHPVNSALAQAPKVNGLDRSRSVRS